MIKIPPFQDAHIHWLREGKPVSLPEALALASDYVRHGIFSVWDMGTADGLGLEIKKTLGRTPRALPRARTCGRALYRQGTYGRFLGWGVAGSEEIKKAVARLAEQGADFLKIIQSGLVSLTPSGGVTAGGFSQEELKVLAAEAEKYHLAVHCHVNGEEAIRQVSEMPVTAIEHGFFIHPETLCRLREQGIAWIPTVYALAHLGSTLDAAPRHRLEEIIEGHLELVAEAVSLGVRVRVGSDSGAAGVPPGHSFFEELRLLKKAGLSPDQLIAAACGNPEETEPDAHLLVREDFVDRGEIESAWFRGEIVAARDPNRG